MSDNSISPRLPPELVLHVFEHSPEATVIACSIVCSQWRDMSIPYMFRDLAVHFAPTSQTDDDANERQTYSGSRGTRKPLSHLLQFLQQSPRIAEKIYHLTIAAVHSIHRYPVPYLSDTDYNSFVGILQILPQLRALTLKDILLPERQSDVLRDAKLDRLTVGFPYHHRRRSVDLHRLLPMLQLFGRVDELFLEYIWFTAAPTPLYFPLQLNVASLTLRKTWSSQLLLSSIQHSQRMDPNNTTLRRVDLRFMGIESCQIRETNSLLDLIGPQLLHLGCSLPSVIFSQANDSTLNLSRCTHLRSATLYIKMGRSSERHSTPNKATWAYLLTVLDSLPFRSSSLNLDQLTLSMHFNKKMGQVEAREYLDIILPQISDVENMLLEWVDRRVVRGVRVEIARPLEGATTSDIDWVFEYFPRLHDAGALVLSLGSWDT